jgi:hypothetical protein
MAKAKSIRWTVGIAVALALPATVAVATPGGASTEKATESAHTKVLTDLTEVVGTLRRPQSAADWLPATARTEVEDLGPAGADAGASVLSLARGAWKLFLTPAPGAVCLSIVDPDGGASTSCHDRDDIVNGRALPAVVREGCELESPGEAAVCTTALIYGVVPNRVSQVSVEVGFGAPPTADVQGNTYLVQVPLDKAPSGVRFDGPHGTVVQPAPIPQG